MTAGRADGAAGTRGHVADLVQPGLTESAGHQVQQGGRSGEPRTILREPLAHFLLIGLLLFLVHGWVARPLTARASGSSSARPAWTTWRASIGRNSAAAADGAAAGEASWTPMSTTRSSIAKGWRRGCGRDDPVSGGVSCRSTRSSWKRRPDRARPPRPTWSRISRRTPQTFRALARVTFDQVFFDTSGPAAEVEPGSKRRGRRWRRGADPASLGQDSMLPRHVELAPRSTWSPATSAERSPRASPRLLSADGSGLCRRAIGAHLVRDRPRATPPSPPPLDAIRADRRPRMGKRPAPDAP